MPRTPRSDYRFNRPHRRAGGERRGSARANALSVRDGENAYDWYPARQDKGDRAGDAHHGYVHARDPKPDGDECECALQ